MIATILIAGVGGLVINFDKFVIPPVALSLILGILMNLILNIKPREKENVESQTNNDEENK